MPENICSWCKKKIPEDFEIFGLGVKFKEGIDMRDKEGKIIPLTLAVTNKTVSAMVTTGNSEAKQDGKDLMFMTCSKRCVKALKHALEKEKEMFGGNIIWCYKG